MVDDLFRGEHSGSEAGMINSSIQTEFETLHEDFVGFTFDAFCCEECVAELIFSQSVVCFEFLFFLHHFAVGGEFFAFSSFTLQTGSVSSCFAFHCRAVRHVPDAIAETTAQFVFCLNFFHPSFLSLED